MKINDNVLISHLDAVYFIGYLKKFEGGGGHFLSDPSMAGLYFCILIKTEVLGTYIPAKRYQSCNVHLASENPIRNNQCIGLVQVFFFSNLQQYITNIQIFKTIPNPGIYNVVVLFTAVLRYAGFNDLKVCKLCVNQHGLKHHIKPLIAYNDIPEQFISYTFVHLAVLLG